MSTVYHPQCGMDIPLPIWASHERICKPEPVTWVFDDGGRAAAGFKGSADDCVTRAIAIGAELPYREVYAEITRRAQETLGRRRARRHTHTASGTPRTASARKPVHRETYEPYLASLGWVWTPTMRVGQGTTVHLRADELPAGRIIVRVSRHVCAVIDGVIHDTHDPSREGTRAVYGYYSRGQ